MTTPLSTHSSSEGIIMYLKHDWFDLREPSERQHQSDMEVGSRTLLKALWRNHARIMSQLTGKMVGP